MIESFFVRLQARRPEFSSAFSFAFGVLAPGAVWNCFRFGFAMLLIGRCQRFALSLFCFCFCFCFCFSLPLCVMPALYKSFAICFALFSARAVRPAALRFGLAVWPISYPERGFLSFFLCSLFFSLVPRLASFKSSAARCSTLVVRTVSGRLRSGFRIRRHTVADRKTRSCPVSKRSASACRRRHRVRPYGHVGARLFSERYRPAMRRTGFSLSAGVRPRTA